MATALIIVDVQGDFLPGGALAVPYGDEVVGPIKFLARENLNDPNNILITTQDWHPFDTPHFDNWPRHCVRGTDGADLHPEIEALNANYAIFKGTQDEDAYSGFDGETNYGDSLAAVLEFERADEVIVTGLALDYCVKATALDAVKNGFKTTVVLSATRAVDPATSDKTVRELREAGVEVTV